MRATVFQRRRRFVYKTVEASANTGIEEIRAEASRGNAGQSRFAIVNGNNHNRVRIRFIVGPT